MKMFILIFISLISLPTFAKTAPAFTKDRVLIGGYDPVSYIKSNSAKKGTATHQIIYQGTPIYFSSAENKKAFQEMPEQYIPAYKGWCAYAMYKDGSLVEVDPEKFKIIKGRTYLFYNGLWADTLKKWNKGGDNGKEPQLIQAADKKWNQKHK